MNTLTKESYMTGEEVFYKCGNEHTWAYLEGKKESEGYVKELEELLRWYVDEDEINEGAPENEYWIEGKHKAMKLLGMEIGE